jgi:SAM-dependent methyltransferase
MKHASTPAYQEDLAYIHDVGHGDFARDAAPHLLKMLAAAGIRDGLIVDLGCGSGIWAKELVDRGYAVHGVDFSPAMIAIARPRVPQATFEAASFLDVKLPPCRAITALGEVLGYALDDRNSVSALTKFFRRCHAALEPGGLLIFDLADLDRHRGVTQGHRAGEDWAVLVDFQRDERRHTITRKIVLFRQVGMHYRRSEETHTLQLFEPKQIADILRKAGFKVRIVRGYGGYRFWNGAAGFVARK